MLPLDPAIGNSLKSASEITNSAIGRRYKYLESIEFMPGKFWSLGGAVGPQTTLKIAKVNLRLEFVRLQLKSESYKFGEC